MDLSSQEEFLQNVSQEVDWGLIQEENEPEVEKTVNVVVNNKRDNTVQEIA